MAAEARADAERAWQTAWQSAEQQRLRREQQLARRCLKHESAACLSFDIPMRLRGGSQGPGRSY